MVVSANTAFICLFEWLINPAIKSPVIQIREQPDIGVALLSKEIIQYLAHALYLSTTISVHLCGFMGNISCILKLFPHPDEKINGVTETVTGITIFDLFFTARASSGFLLLNMYSIAWMNN